MLLILDILSQLLYSRVFQLFSLYKFLFSFALFNTLFNNLLLLMLFVFLYRLILIHFYGHVHFQISISCFINVQILLYFISLSFNLLVNRPLPLDFWFFFPLSFTALDQFIWRFDVFPRWGSSLRFFPRRGPFLRFFSRWRAPYRFFPRWGPYLIQFFPVFLFFVFFPLRFWIRFDDRGKFDGTTASGSNFIGMAILISCLESL